MPPTRSNCLSSSARRDLGLQRQRQVADFVQKQRPAMRQLESAWLPGRRARERTLLVAEQLGLQQRVWNRRAVDRHEWTVVPRAQRVQRAGKELLAVPLSPSSRTVASVAAARCSCCDT